jgi:DNA (cytosine-5)-methyltransferase 1
MNYGSVCSGVESATLAWKRLGWTAKFFAEVEPFPVAVLHHRFDATRPLRSLDPAEAASEKERKERDRWQRYNAELPDGGSIPNLGDFTRIKENDYNGNIDLLVGGTPCQSYSVAGLRKGIEDPRGNLALEFVKLAYRTGSRWICWENVPGVLSSGKGQDFASFLSLLCGWEVAAPKPRWSKSGIITPASGCFGLAWRIMDAQYTRVESFPHAVPQRRRRLFVIGYLGEWLYPAQVLFDGEMRVGDTPPRREKRKRLAKNSQGGAHTAKSIRMRGDSGNGGKGALVGTELSHTLATGNDQTIVCLPEDEDKTCFDIRQVELNETELAPTLIATDYKGGKAISIYHQRKAESMCPLEECSNTLTNGTAPGHQNAVCFENHGNDSRVKEVEVSPTLTKRLGTGGNNTPIVFENTGKCSRANQTKVSQTITSSATSSNKLPLVLEKNNKVASHEQPRCEKDAQRKDGEPSAHDAADLLGFIKNDAGGDQDGYWEDVFPTIRSQVTPAVAVAENIIGRQAQNGGNGVGAKEEVSYTLNCTGVHGVAHNATVRRLLPIECERLMGFPDNHTRIPWKGKPEEDCPNAPRYKACGNSMCVNVMSWLGERINQVENNIQKQGRI